MSYTPPPGPPAGPPPGAPPNSQLALASIITGAVGLVFALLCGIGFVFSVAAIITGVIALNQINQSPATIGGKNLAIIGISLGGAGIVLSGLVRFLIFNS